jgi:hypothetical protein
VFRATALRATRTATASTICWSTATTPIPPSTRTAAARYRPARSPSVAATPWAPWAARPTTSASWTGRRPTATSWMPSTTKRDWTPRQGPNMPPTWRINTAPAATSSPATPATGAIWATIISGWISRTSRCRPRKATWICTWSSTPAIPARARPSYPTRSMPART